jgi:hypothetical protein
MPGGARFSTDQAFGDVIVTLRTGVSASPAVLATVDSTMKRGVKLTRDDFVNTNFFGTTMRKNDAATLNAAITDMLPGRAHTYKACVLTASTPAAAAEAMKSMSIALMLTVKLGTKMFSIKDRRGVGGPGSCAPMVAVGFVHVSSTSAKIGMARRYGTPQSSHPDFIGRWGEVLGENNTVLPVVNVLDDKGNVVVQGLVPRPGRVV